jgi:4-aminobutyrate--pyruvate transaminase
VVRAIGDRIAFTPPLIMTEAETALMCRRFGQGLDAAWMALREEAAIPA